MINQLEEKIKEYGSKYRVQYNISDNVIIIILKIKKLLLRDTQEIQTYRYQELVVIA